MPVKYLMVSVVQLHPQSSAAALGPLAEGLAAPERVLIGRALEFAEPLYAGQLLSSGEPAWSHALGLAASLAAIGLDAPGRAAGVLFAPITCSCATIWSSWGSANFRASRAGSSAWPACLGRSSE